MLSLAYYNKGTINDDHVNMTGRKGIEIQMEISNSTSKFHDSVLARSRLGVS